jgi:hypothetical protein
MTISELQHLSSCEHSFYQEYFEQLADWRYDHCPICCVFMIRQVCNCFERKIDNRMNKRVSKIIYLTNIKNKIEYVYEPTINIIHDSNSCNIC